MRLWGVEFLVLLISVSVVADTVTLRPAADTALFESFPNDNFGGQIDLPSGTIGTGQRSRALFKFDFGKIPTNAQVQSVKVILRVTRAPTDAISSTFALHRVLRSWGEGVKKGDSPGGDTATAGEATWRARFAPDQLWGAGGGEAGVDYEAGAAATQPVNGVGVYTFALGALVQDVQGWLLDPSSNFGWMLISQSEQTSHTARRFGARESPSNFPVLVLEYTVAAALAAPRISSLELRSGEALIHFEAVAGVTYTLETMQDLFLGSWQDQEKAGPFPQGGESTFTNAMTAGASGYYRLRAE